MGVLWEPDELALDDEADEADEADWPPPEPPDRWDFDGADDYTDDSPTVALLDDMREIAELCNDGSGDALGGLEYLSMIARIAERWVTR